MRQHQIIDAEWPQGRRLWPCWSHGHRIGIMYRSRRWHLCNITKQLLHQRDLTKIGDMGGKQRDASFLITAIMGHGIDLDRREGRLYLVWLGNKCPAPYMRLKRTRGTLPPWILEAVRNRS